MRCEKSAAAWAACAWALMRLCRRSSTNGRLVSGRHSRNIQPYNRSAKSSSCRGGHLMKPDGRMQVVQFVVSVL
jgi:hypothetical protein